jgi:hypothetical protein
MSDTKTVNGYDVVTWEHRDHRIPSYARNFCAALGRGHPAVERIDHDGFGMVSVWIDDDNEQESFEVPDGWTVETAGVYGGGVCLDIVREADR